MRLLVSNKDEALLQEMQQRMKGYRWELTLKPGASPGKPGM